MIVEREIGRARGTVAGPTLIVTVGVHGNEVAGVSAARRVLERLVADQTPIVGDFVVLAGNVLGMRLGKRYQVKDLNRQWTKEKVAATRARDPSLDDAEDREQRELLVHLDRALAAARGPVFHVDLHTTSASGYPFGIYDSADQDAFAAKFPLAMIGGLAAALAGVLSSYMGERGATALAVEGGQHDDPATVEHLDATLTVALAACGLADPAHLPDLARATAHLDAVRGAIPRTMEVVARYAIVPDDAFVMAPGFANLAHVVRGQLLAKDRRGAIHAPSDGFVVLPLYQGQGDDGFFFGRAVRRRQGT